MALHAWTVSSCAPAEAPAFLIDGQLLGPGGALPLPAHRLLHNGWGRRSATHLVGPTAKETPTALRLAWFSFAEDRFYAGQFPLPTAALDALLARGCTEPGSDRRLPWDSLIAGVAPGGAVALWVAARAWTREVATWRARQVDLPWTQVLDNPAITRATHVARTLASASTPPGALREAASIETALRRHRRHPWQPSAHGAGVVVTRIVLRCWNGEVEAAPVGTQAPASAAAASTPRGLRAPPQSVTLAWTGRDGQRRGAELGFDEAEVMEGLRAAGGLDGTTPMQLDLRIEPGGRSVRAALRSSRGALVLRETRVHVHRLSS
ncbi:DUF2931 family protein [Piscinibacter sakaiensis]|uniref:DUF2931 family protein n=1 Tax=Piscinibacter sakaiensis TaxID=1547922 RepID=A0A0K8P0R4_PISS1|nr:DUF2931 family protein [Piscinibacter sakaiensis]GAP36218.1 hypothetical protein ISF6_2058 [Piscinibacter sakaiensis]